VSQSLLAFDTDHIKRYVFGTSKLKEIRGASSILDDLNRTETVKATKASTTRKIFAHGGSALFLIDEENAEQEAEQLGKTVQKLYRDRTGDGASITYAVQPIPTNSIKDIMKAEQVTPDVSMEQVLQLLRVRLRLAKDSQQMGASHYISLPTHALLCICKSCGMAYAEDILPDPDEPDSRYCRICKGKRDEDENVRKTTFGKIRAAQSPSRSNEDEHKEQKLWDRILRTLSKQGYDLSGKIDRPSDFQAFRDLTNGKGYLGLIYADANSMGKAIEAQKTLAAVEQFAQRIDDAVFTAMGEAIKEHLPVQKDMLPFDVLLVGGDDIVMVTSADKALTVARTLAEQFHKHSGGYTLSVGVVLAPVTYPFNLQLKLAEDILKDAKKTGAKSQVKSNGAPEEARISFVVITGSTSLSYEKLHHEMERKATNAAREEFQATLRPYTLRDFTRLLDRLQAGKELRLGRTKLHQLREAILKLNRTTTILESLALLRNWNTKERDFIREMVQELDNHLTQKEREQRGTLFPWYLESAKEASENDTYRTPLLDFVELYDFVSL